jgi:hypothetical protein
MDNSEILQHVKEMMADILASPRWDNPDEPNPATIKHIGERVKSAESMQRIRENEDYVRLLNTVCYFEEALNDDWMPFEILGLPLGKARKFLSKLYQEFDNVQEGEWARTIKKIYQETGSLF